MIFFLHKHLITENFHTKKNSKKSPLPSFGMFLTSEVYISCPATNPSLPLSDSLSLPPSPSPSLHVLVHALHRHKQGDGVPADRLKAHELFQAWEEQCATQSAAQTCDFAESHAKLLELPAADCPTQHRGPESPTPSIREGAELHSQVDNVRQRIAKLSVQLQSPTAVKPPR